MMWGDCCERPRPLSFTSFSSSGLRHPASASCLERHSRLAGRCPNSSSLFPPQAAVVAVAPKGRANGGSRQGSSEYNLSVGLTPASSPGRGAFGKEVSSQRKGKLAGLSAPPEPPLLGELASSEAQMTERASPFSVTPRNPGRRGSYSRGAPCCRPRPHGRGGWRNLSGPRRFPGWCPA